MSKRHEHWGSRIGFLLASAGSAIGLGSLWRFPYVTGENGGGAFVLLYLLFTACIALPALIGEFILGRMSQRSSVLAYAEIGSSNNWRILGWLSFLTTFLIVSYYNVVAGWTLNYALMSLVQFTKGKSPQEIQEAFSILYDAGDINLFWLLIYMLINVGVVLSGVRKGIERWSRILMPILFIILIGMFFFSITLPGFPKAFTFLMTPDFSKVTSTTVLTALGMSFFTISVGLGINVTYGSYLRENESIPKLSVLIAGMTTFVSIIAALMIFPIIFTYNFPPEGGPGLIFKTMPLLFSRMPASILLSTVFFLLVVFAALTSTIALLEVLVANVMEVFEWTRKKSVWVVSVAIFVMAIPSALAGSNTLFSAWKQIYGENFFDTLSSVTADWMMPIAALGSTLFIGWKIEKEARYREYIRPVDRNMFYWLWNPLIKYFAPLSVIIILLQKAGLV